MSKLKLGKFEPSKTKVLRTLAASSKLGQSSGSMSKLKQGKYSFINKNDCVLKWE